MLEISTRSQILGLWLDLPAYVGSSLSRFVFAHQSPALPSECGTLAQYPERATSCKLGGRRVTTLAARDGSIYVTHVPIQDVTAEGEVVIARAVAAE